MASAGARFESARASGDAAAARAAVEDIVTDAKDPAKRAALASSGAAVSIAAELLRAARAKCWCDAADATQASDASLVPFAPLARALRNVCAGNAVARGGACALPHRAAPEALALAIPALAARVDAPDAKNDAISDASSVATKKKEETTAAYVAALAAATQLACNLIAGGGAAADTTWVVLFPRHFGVIASLRHRGAAHSTHPALCAAMHARLAVVGSRPADPHDDSKVCGFLAGAIVWRPLLRASIGDDDDDDHDDDDKHKHAGVGGGEMLFRFVESFCLFAGDAAPPLCRSLAPRAAETARARDDALRRKIMSMCVAGDGEVRVEIENDARDDTSLRERFSVEQATLLELVSRAAAAAPKSDPSRERDRREPSPPDENKNEPPATLVLSEGTAAYVLDLASRAAEAVERARSSDERETELSSELDSEEVSQADAARVTLRACLGVLRAVTEREVRPALAQTPGDDVASLCAMGMPRLLLGLLASLPVPEGAGNSGKKKKKASGPSAAPDLSPATFLPRDEDVSSVVTLAERLREGHAPYPSSRPWDGYRVDALAPLANAMFGRPAVCDAVYDLGGVPVLLACTRGEDGDEYLREYALWAVRNVCAGSDAARGEIEAMQPRAAADAHELAAAGLRVAVDPVTGRVKIGNVDDARDPRRFANEKVLNVSGDVPGGSGTVPAGTPRGIGGRLMLSGGGERARTPVGRAIQAALEAGLEPTPEKDDEDAEVPKHWKIADLS